MENSVILKIILNHFEERKINNQKFNVYTLTDFSSGNNFDIWSLQKYDFLDNMKLLIEVKPIKFNLYISKDNKIKLKPIELAKGV